VGLKAAGACYGMRKCGASEQPGRKALWSSYPGPQEMMGTPRE
jgi:hypothetical protein